ncbi:lysozyme inhibitor LprI family protein [Pseudomonas cremoricolorata]|uniref:lysozyme inhibitor LprI family protein n=1 Tax=Pseudomonas cremoricolorata TaxID=157783 RepID=UPI00048F676C|nr:lysozyme inhibitor LprI family protein [Pseudomonas cremoricolorata]
MKAMVWLVLLGVMTGAQAGEEDSTPCDNVDTEQQTYACAAFNRQTAERELKSAFDDLLQRLREQYPNQSSKVSDLSARLQAAQTQWMQLRDADCKLETFAEQPGSKAYEAALNTCLALRSDDRSEYLQSLAQQ